MKTRNWSDSTQIQRKADLMSKKIEDDILILSIEQGRYYGSEAGGALIWETIAQATSFKALLSLLLETYAVDETLCRQELTGFLNQLYAENLIETWD